MDVHRVGRLRVKAFRISASQALFTQTFLRADGIRKNSAKIMSCSVAKTVGLAPDPARFDFDAF